MVDPGPDPDRVAVLSGPVTNLINLREFFHVSCQFDGAFSRQSRMLTAGAAAPVNTVIAPHIDPIKSFVYAARPAQRGSAAARRC